MDFKLNRNQPPPPAPDEVLKLEEVPKPYQEKEKGGWLFRLVEKVKASRLVVKVKAFFEKWFSGNNHMLRIISGLAVGFLFFYVLADYTAYTAGQIHAGEMIISNTMVQLWTATYRLIFILLVSMALIALAWQGLWQFFKPSDDRNFDLFTSIRYDLTPPQRICLFFAVLFSFCFLFVMLLSVKLPELVSGSR